jgi:hypothetical protein
MNRDFTFILTAVFYSTTAAGAPVLPDPTKPPDYSVNIQASEETSEPVTDFNLTAIRIDKGDRSAIINGRLARVGDMTGPARVLEINPAGVVLYYDQSRHVVRLYDRVVKTERDAKARGKVLN